MVQATIASMNIMNDFIGNKGDGVEGFTLSGGLQARLDYIANCPDAQESQRNRSHSL